MRILIAFDTHSYSSRIVSEVAKLAANTWADITMLAVQPAGSGNKTDATLAKALRQYRTDFIDQFDAGDQPYGGNISNEEFVQKNGAWELSKHSPALASRKELLLKIRVGDPAKEILAEAREHEADLIVLGCTKGLDSQWKGEVDLPQKIAKKAACSVVVIKEKKVPTTLTCCLDQTHVSQSSLEMINQIVTLYQAELKIVGLTDNKGTDGKAGVENSIAQILKYYAERQISAWIKLVRPEDLEEYVAEVSRENMVGLWMGKKSLLGKIFSPNLVGKLVNHSQSSVLILR
ncbi:MAG: universal stress protein [Proteobacteria bacterium]|nr:universal stress protein [Pseudomonadota bacterium]MBU1641270.1 universal stress protein [Pseudomonadota bacterium]